MSFEEVYKKYVDGTANEEERIFVENELAKSREILNIIEREGAPHMEEPQPAVIMQAKKRFSLLATVRIALVSLLVVLLLAGIVSGAVFGYAASCAGKSLSINLAEAEDIAVEFVRTYKGGIGKISVLHSERELELGRNLAHSTYIYEVEIYNGIEKIEVEINGRTGIAMIVD